MSSQDKLNEELFGAVVSRDVDRVRTALSRGGDVNSHSSIGQWTPLHRAVYNGDSKVLRILLEAGGDPNSTDESNDTPLIFAAMYGHTEVADLLIQSGATVDAINENGRSPLHYACDDGHIDKIKLLLSKGADPNIVDKDNKTPADYINPGDKNKAIILEALQNAIQDYSGVVDEALKEGHVTARWSKFATSGAPGTGKSSIIKLLLDENPPEKHHSTAVGTKPEVRRVDITGFVAGGNFSSPQWNKVSRESLQRMLAKGMKQGVKAASSKSTKHNKDDNESSSSSDDDGTSKESKAASSVSQSFSAAATEIAKIMPRVEKSPELYQSHWVYAVDSGGQAAFLDISPALLRSNPVSILTLKLNEKLKDRPKFYFSFKGELIGEPVERQITNMQLLESSFRSLSSIDQPRLHNIHVRCSYDKPTLLVLGTFYDKINECIGESLDDKNASLWSNLKQFKDVRLSYREDEKEVIFPINTTARGKNEKEMAEFIRGVVCRSYIEAEIPARWFLFQLDLEEVQKSTESMVVSKNECLRIGNALKMNRRDVEACLMYYHDLTIFLFFPNILPNVVFLHPQPLFNKLSELISISFADAVAHLRKMNIVLPPNAHCQLKNEGTFKRELLDCIPDGFTSDFTADDFLLLMEDILVVARLSEEGKYFIPCVLPTTSVLDTIRSPFLKYMDSLVLTWEMHPIPQGLFPALVVNMINRQTAPKFDIFQSSGCSDQVLQYRNAIRLSSLDLAGAVLLVDAVYWLEVHYSGRSDRCLLIRQAVYDGIDVVVKKFQYKPILTMPQQRFRCSFCTYKEEHLCRPDDAKTILTCCWDGITIADINHERQTPWLEETKLPVTEDISSILTMKPELTDLLGLLADISYEWEIIGVALKVRRDVLGGLRSSPESNTIKIFRVIEAWIDAFPSKFSWLAVIKAVEGPIVNHQSTAMTIRQYLAKPEVQLSYKTSK